MRYWRIYFLSSLLLLKKAANAFKLDYNGEAVLLKYSGTEITRGEIIKNGDTVRNLTADQTSVDVTDIACNPETKKVWIAYNNGTEKSDLTKDLIKYLPRRRGAYSCRLEEAGKVTINVDNFWPICYYGGTVRYGDDKHNITVREGDLKAKLNCNKSLILEIWSKYELKLGSCSIYASECYLGKAIF